jgi:hypothetical protein
MPITFLDLMIIRVFGLLVEEKMYQMDWREYFIVGLVMALVFT